MALAAFSGRARGYSLLEVLVAVVVVSIGFLALAALQTGLIRSAAAAKAQTLALAVAKQKIEQLSAVQSLGGADNGCVSPTDWNTGEDSCYRAITDEDATAFDGDPADPGLQPLGGIDFTVATEVSRYMYNVSTGLYGLVADTALDAALVTTSPETFLPGKEFKRIVVTVGWTDPTGTAQVVQVEDAINGIVPRDSVALLQNPQSMAGRKAELLIGNPANTAGVIPIAVGNESTTATSNPSPELLGAKNSTYVAETRFDSYTYLPLDPDRARAQSRVETLVVGCRCSTAAASETATALRPAYWDGLRYVPPVVASYDPPAGPKPVGSGELPQSVQCRACCRDHHDPTGDDANGVALSAPEKFSPRRGSHDHFLVDSSGNRMPASDTYSEVCRMVRVDGVFRVAPDLYNDYFALLPAANQGLSAFAPEDEVAEDYADMVRRYLDGRVTDQDDAARIASGDYGASLYNASHNGGGSGALDPAGFETGSRLMSDGVTSRSYDLDAPANYLLKPSADSKWLHARGLYIDYLGAQAIDRIDAAKASCPDDVDPGECVLPYLPFSAINLSEIAEWKDIAELPTPTGPAQVLAVMNNGFASAIADASYTETGASGAAGQTVITFAAAISSKIVVGMTAAGSGLGDGARVVARSNTSVTLDKPHIATLGGSVVFQAAPVRGLVNPGSAPMVADTAFAKAIASYNNAALALGFPMHPDEAVLDDSQHFEISATGDPPSASAGTFFVGGFTDAGGTLYPFGTPYPVLEWGIGASGTFSINACLRGGSPLPYQCFPTSGLGGPMRIRLSGYNVRLSVSESFNSATHSATCTKPNGSTVIASGTTMRPYCKNFDVLSASTASTSATGTTPFTVVNAGKANETTELLFPTLGNGETITLGLGANGVAAGEFVACTASNAGALTGVTWTDPCQ